MKRKVSDYIADFAADHGITDIFTVPGGLAMHMNDSFGHHPRIRCTYNHHEQASAMAAEAYARLSGRMAGVCVTAGPGTTNAVTGVLGCFMGSQPLVVFSGQTRIPTSVGHTGLPLRSRGIQECDIVSIVKPITKYAVTVRKPEEIRYHLEKAFHFAKTGRPGPVWLDIPLDVQGGVIETEALAAYDSAENPELIVPKVSAKTVSEILDRLQGAERPVLFPGFGVRSAGAHASFIHLAEILGAPVVTGVSSVDAIAYDHPLYTGHCGGTGDRAGNFAVQNSDVFFSIGCRLSYSQTGFQTDTWAREAYVIMSDIDPYEIRKEDLHVSLPLQADAGELIGALLEEAQKRGASAEKPLCRAEEWRKRCLAWKQTYKTVGKEHYEVLEEGRTNTYAFYEELSGLLPSDAILMASCGTSRVIGSQVFRIREGQRFITNSNTASMGFDLPAILGLSRASGGKEIVCVTGEGSLMMNLQEFETLRQNRIPFKLIIVNNEGYHSVRQTQKGYFQTSLVGVGEESGDLSFPDPEKLAAVFGFSYCSVGDPAALRETLRNFLEMKGQAICQVYVTKLQATLPKTSSRKLPDGSMVSAPLEDMFPFLSREELKENMYIELDKGSLAGG
ncbi:MAG: thiamine pyrophosphate-binding protein [Lachnospiraceae bacterium]|nr:thiamine pyrophosphate-binding protein [Lachnospiraceae bacterium]